MRFTNPDRRDWRMILFVLPIGILLMIFAGQLAIRMVPNWSVTGNMESGLDPKTASGQDPSLLPPVSEDILTPMAWIYTFLTPGPNSGDDISYPSLVVFDPTSTPTTTPTPIATTVTPSASPTATTTTPTATSTPTKKPTGTGTVAVCTDPAANNVGGPLPCTYPPAVCTDPAANNVGNPLPCTYDPPPVCTDPSANNVGDPLPCTYDPVCTETLANNFGGPLPCTYDPPPPGFNEGPPDGPPAGHITNGNYVVIRLTASPIIVNGASDTNYDLVYYEQQIAGGGIAMDSVILSISSDGTTYYVIFNWGDGTPDNNSNIGDVAASAGGEVDDEIIPASELHGSPIQTGVLIDVDNAPSAPPPGSYQYLAIQAPLAPVSDSNLDVDSVEVTEVAP